MDWFEFEELLADMMDITDDQRDEDDDVVHQELHDRFDIDFEGAFEFTKALLRHTPVVEAGISGTKYHAFISKSHPFMLMKMKSEV